MERGVFVERFQKAAAQTREFACGFVVEPLPEALRFRVLLNQSVDSRLHEDERVFPDDVSPLAPCTEAEVIALLWREGRVPEWVDLSVVGLSGAATLVELRCCGRFTSNETLLYHQRAGLPPLHVQSPALPAEHVQGQRFSLFERGRAECCTVEEVGQLRAYAPQVRSVELIGEGASDAGLAELPELPALQHVTLRESRASCEGLGVLCRQPALRGLTLEPLRFTGFPALPWLMRLTLRRVSPACWSVDDLTRACPRLKSLTLEADGALALDGALPALMDDVRLTADSFSGNLRLPGSLDALRLRLRSAAPAEVERLCLPVKYLHSLDLSGTPVDDALVERLLSRWRLRSLELHHTKVSDGLRERLRSSLEERAGQRFLRKVFEPLQRWLRPG